jgi:hypothetical protein
MLAISNGCIGCAADFGLIGGGVTVSVVVSAVAFPVGGRGRVHSNSRVASSDPPIPRLIPAVTRPCCQAAIASTLVSRTAGRSGSALFQVKPVVSVGGGSAKSTDTRAARLPMLTFLCSAGGTIHDPESPRTPRNSPPSLAGTLGNPPTKGQT